MAKDTTRNYQRRNPKVKSKTQIETVKDWQQADELIKQIGELSLQIQQEEKAANDIIIDAKVQLAEDTKPLFKKITVLTDSLEAFAANNIKDFGKAQSRRLNFGILGWRKSSEINVKKTTLDLIKKMFGKKAEQYLHIKETVNKEALESLQDAELASVDARRTNKEPFFVEPDLPKAIDL